MTDKPKLPEPTEVRPFTMNVLTGAYARELPLTDDGFFQGPTEGEVLRALYAFLADDPVPHALAILNAGGEARLASQLSDAHAELERNRQAEATAKVLACPDGSDEERADHWAQMYVREQFEWIAIASRMISMNYEFGGAESEADAATTAQRAAREASAKLERFGKGGSR